MPAGLQSVDSSFKQLQKEYIGYAQRKQALILEVGMVVFCLELVPMINFCIKGNGLQVAGHEACLARLKQAIRQERQAIGKATAQPEILFTYCFTFSLLQKASGGSWKKKEKPLKCFEVRV